MSNYTPTEPTFSGRKIFPKIDILQIVKEINWSFFFSAWKLTGNYAGIETLCDCISCQTQWLLKYPLGTERDKAKEALSLFRDAQTELREIILQNKIQIEVLLYFSEVKGTSNGISFLKDETEYYFLPTLRQQHPSERNGYCVSLSDFISPQKDYLGIFAIAVHGGDELAEQYAEQGDDYQALLVKSIADRLAEATSCWLHEKVRKEIWGYDKEGETGIRPAIGYPSLPDQSLLFDINKIVHLNDIGIKLTENGAMKPNASVCGLYIAHPKSFYFLLGKIGNDQRKIYAKQRGMCEEELDKWLGHK